MQGVVSAGALDAIAAHNLAITEVLEGQVPEQVPVELSGKRFDLILDTLPVNFTGHRTIATGINGSSPGPTLR